MTWSWSQLPHDILLAVIQYLDISDRRNLCLVHPDWNHVVQPSLYTSMLCPGTDSYLALVETLLSRHDLAAQIRILDLSRVVGTLKTVRLPEVLKLCLGIREFYCPQAAITPILISVIAGLVDLRILDLECCIERFEISRVINNCLSLPKLHSLLFPRCSIGTIYPIKAWPDLQYLALRGGLKDDFLRKITQDSHPRLGVRKLMISHAPSITSRPTLSFLSSLTTLHDLTISWPIMRFDHNSMDSLLALLPQLKRLSIAVDYISPRFFESRHNNLEELTLHFSGVGKHRILALDDFVEFIEDEDHFPMLRSLGIGHKLGDLLFKDDESTIQFRQSCAIRMIRVEEVRDSIDES